MARFTFRLDAPLRLARVRRGELRRTLAALVRDGAEIEAQAGAERARAADIEADRAERAAEGMPGDEVALASRARESCESRARRLERRLDRLRGEERKVRDDLAAVGRQVQVLERLRSEARATHVKELIDREQAQTDDLTLRRMAVRDARRRERVSQ